MTLVDPASSALLTDLYELTMALGYWREGRAEQEAAFQLYFRTAPFRGGYTIACGLEPAVAYLQGLRFTDGDLTYLATLRGADESPLFPAEFLDVLGSMRLALDVDMVPEGTVVFPNEPLVRVRGPLLQGQLVETALLTHIGFSTLVATKAARMCLAADGGDVLEFGLRRAQGPDGGLMASRAAYIGGCSSTSNVLAGQRYGIPVKGTHAHSWVMVFDDELEAFRAYAEAMPNNVVFLVDTYDTIDGVRHAVDIGRRLRANGHRLLGVRLDSGDLAFLSTEARRILDDAGFTDTAILASNDLDEHLITSLKQQGAAITVWGIGTRLTTAYDQPALGAVYKLSAVRDASGAWLPRVKVSEQSAKTTHPGLLQVWRYYRTQPDARRGTYVGDMLVDELIPPSPGDDVTMVDPLDVTRRKRFGAGAPFTRLLEPAMRGGARVSEPEALPAVRERVINELAGFHAGIKRLVNPHRYPVGVERGLHDRNTALVLATREHSVPTQLDHDTHALPNDK
jgi:nicotinate phosphoribosyltransferase